MPSRTRPRSLLRVLAPTLLLASRAAAQMAAVGANGGEGGALTGPVSSPEAAGYSCDSSKCKLPDCLCASTSPPGGLDPKNVPQFVTFTADDAIQLYTKDVMSYFLGGRKNPNGCTPRMTYFTSLSYTNYSMVTEMYVNNNTEIADHTMTHAGKPNASEVYGNLRALNAFAGIPMSDLVGFRAPLLSWNGSTLETLHNASFVYDSSMTSATPANATPTDAWWPYTLDNGVANNCLEQQDICQGRLKLPGLWEIPMYSTFGNSTTALHLMDPWLDSNNPAEVLEWLKYSFLTHYEGNRQPFGLYSHPIHLAVGYPGVDDPIAMREMLQEFLDWVQSHDNVWIVSNTQLLAWMRNPVANDKMGNVDALKCTVPDVPKDEKICNGIPQNMGGLLNKCDFHDFPWQTCYYCPVDEPTPDNPVPLPREGDTRHTLPDNCLTAFFDPIANKCTCDSDKCSFEDQTKPIGNYTSNLGGQSGASGASTATSAQRTAPSKQNSSAARAGLQTIPADSRVHDKPTEDNHVSSTVYGSRAAATGIPRLEMGEDEMEPRMAQRFIQDELLMNGNPAMNLASFVTTFMEPEAEQLMASQLAINYIDAEEYPAMEELNHRCTSMIARLFNAPLEDENAEAVGTSTVGSSEAIILAVLAAKRRWKNKRKAEGKSTENPNIVMSSAVQVCWEKAARYTEVEERYWYCRPGQYVADPQELVDLVDEHTILVVAILGTTYTGQYEDVASINDALEKKNKDAGLDVTIHVDAASGGFVAPFVNPDLVWDFRLPLVSSINTSGHKYGLVYAGVGWAFWRNASFLPEEILFTVNYLGAPQVSFTLNFSKSAVNVLGQYYQLLRLGKSGYRAIMQNLTATADYLAAEIKTMGNGMFEIISDGGGAGLPLVAFRIVPEKAYDEFAIAAHMRQRGWIIPAYTMAPHTEQMKLLRVVVREDLSHSRCETLCRDLKETIDYLETAPAAVQKHLSKSQDAGDPHSKHHPTHHMGRRQVHVHEKHSLAGKHGKTHAAC
ncbi:hypothetical protein JCM3770_005666 [Rhodotorula araucariae]